MGFGPEETIPRLIGRHTMIPMRPGSMKLLMLLSVIGTLDIPLRQVRAQGLEEDIPPEPLRASDLTRDNELPAGPIPMPRGSIVDGRGRKKFEGTVKPKAPPKKSRAARKKLRASSQKKRDSDDYC